MQAGVTDNVPLHVLGGNIIPVALGQEFMTTTAVRNATLALVVALPKENSTATGEPPAHQLTRPWAHLLPPRTCGHTAVCRRKSLYTSLPRPCCRLSPHCARRRQSIRQSEGRLLWH